MKIRRSRLTADFVQIPNRTARDERLGYMARGILTDLLSRPDGWEATAKDLWLQARQARGESAESRRKFEAAFAELKTAGYLVASREQREGGRFTTVLTLHDVPACRADAPHAGMSARPGETDVSAGHTGIPTTGMPVALTDVPACGTSESPAETNVLAGHTDVPAGGVSEPPGKTGVSAGRTDIPAAGMSKEKTVLENGKENSLSAPEQVIMKAFDGDITEEETREIISLMKDDALKKGDPIVHLGPFVRTVAANGDLPEHLARVRAAAERRAAYAARQAQLDAEVPRPCGDESPPSRAESIAALRARIGSRRTERPQRPRPLTTPPKAEDPVVQAAYDRLNQCGDYDRWWIAARQKLPDAHRDEVVLLADQLAHSAPLAPA